MMTWNSSRRYDQSEIQRMQTEAEQRVEEMQRRAKQVAEDTPATLPVVPQSQPHHQPQQQNNNSSHQQHNQKPPQQHNLLEQIPIVGELAKKFSLDSDVLIIIGLALIIILQKRDDSDGKGILSMFEGMDYALIFALIYIML